MAARPIPYAAPVMSTTFPLRDRLSDDSGAMVAVPSERSEQVESGWVRYRSFDSLKGTFEIVD